MKKKLKLKKSILKYLIIIASFIFCITLIIFLCSKKPYVGKIKNGKAKYIDRVVNVTNYKNEKIIIEFENGKELIDNCFMTTELYEKFKNKDSRYNLTIKDYFKLNDISAKENYNINKSLQMDYIDEDTKYMDYFAMTCGFKDKKELMEYTDEVIKLAKKVK